MSWRTGVMSTCMTCCMSLGDSEQWWSRDPFLTRLEAYRAGDPSLNSSVLWHTCAKKQQVRSSCLSTEPRGSLKKGVQTNVQAHGGSVFPFSPNLCKKTPGGTFKGVELLNRVQDPSLSQSSRQMRPESHRSRHGPESRRSCSDDPSHKVHS